MADGTRTIGIRFTGAADDLQKASATADESIDRVASSAENLDDKGSKATDSLGALSSGFELVGLEQYAAGLQGAAMATDFLSGVGTGLNLIMELQSVQWVKNKVAAVAYAVQQKVVAAASRVWAAAQWVLNAALSANPIGLVILAIAGLILIIKLAWERSTTFREIVTGALNAVLSVAKAVGSWFRNTFWPWLRDVWTAVSGAVGKMRDKIAGHFDALVKWLGGIPGRVGSALSGLWGGITSGLGTARDWVKEQADGLVKWFSGLPGRMSSAVSGMFDGITGAFRSAINYVIGRWNDLSFSIPGVDTHIPGVGTVGGFTLSTPNIPMLELGGRAIRAGAAVVGERGPELITMARGASVVPLDQGGGDTYVIVEMDGRQFDARIKSVTREDRRATRRAVTAGALRGAPA